MVKRAAATSTQSGNRDLENVERTQFVVLTGHLDDRPLPELIRTLRVQRKSGRLQVEYPDAPGAFFFEDGQLVDAQLGTLRGVDAVHAALSMRGASFNFNPLVRPPDRSIDGQGQKFIGDLVEAPRRENLAEIRAVTEGGALSSLQPVPQRAPLQLAGAAELVAPLEERLTAVEAAIDSASQRFSRERLIYGLVISFLVGLTVVTALQAILYTVAIPPAPATGETSAHVKPAEPNAAGDNSAAPAVAGRAGVAPSLEPRTGGGSVVAGRVGLPQSSGQAKREESAARPTQIQAEMPPAAARRSVPAGHVVQVLMEVKDGQVTTARVLNPRPGAGAYEALALRMARQRRYPDNFTGGDTLKLRVK